MSFDVNKSFSLSFSQYLLSSNILYPPDCKLQKIEDKGSIKESIGLKYEFFEQRKAFSPAWFNQAPLKPVVYPVIYIVRIVSVLAVGVLVSSIGTVFHLLKTTGFLLGLNLIFSGKKIDYINNLKQSAKAFLNDMVVTLIKSVAVAIVALVIASMYFVGVSLTVSELLAGLGGLVAYSLFCIAIGIYLFIITGVPDLRFDRFFSILGNKEELEINLNAIPFLNKKERSLLYKAMALRNDFGIVNQSGGFLSYDEKIDQEELNQPSHFTQLRAKAALDILNLLLVMKKSFPDTHEIETFFIPQEIPTPDIDRFFIPRFLWNEGRMTPRVTTTPKDPTSKEAVTKYFEHLFETHKESTYGKIWSEDYQKLSATLRKITNFSEEILNIQHARTERIGNLRKDYFIELSEFPYKKEFIVAFFALSALPNEEWLKTLKETIDNFKVETRGALPSEEYAKFKKQIRAMTAPSQILKLGEKPSKRTLSSQYRQLARFVHSDKVPNEYKEEADNLFKLLKKAQELIEQEIEKSS